MNFDLIKDTRIFENQVGERHAIPQDDEGFPKHPHQAIQGCACAPVRELESGLWIHNKIDG